MLTTHSYPVSKLRITVPILCQYAFMADDNFAILNWEFNYKYKKYYAFSSVFSVPDGYYSLSPYFILTL